VKFRAFFAQEIWSIVQGFEVRNQEKNYVCTVFSQVIFATVYNRKDENFSFYPAVCEFQVLTHFRDFGARNVISE
jgi:hypothetical protein